MMDFTERKKDNQNGLNDIKVISKNTKLRAEFSYNLNEVLCELIRKYLKLYSIAILRTSLFQLSLKLKKCLHMNQYFSS